MSYKFTVEQILLPLGVRGISGVTGATRVDDCHKCDVVLYVAAMDPPQSGTAGISAEIESSPLVELPGDNDWYAAGIVPFIDSASLPMSLSRTVEYGLCRWLRIRYLISGAFNPPEGVKFEIQLTKHARL